MREKRLRRCIAMLGALILCMGCARAENVIVVERVAVYAQASTSSKKLGTAASGTKLTLVAEKGGWAKVELNGNEGYMKSSVLAKQVNMTAYASKDGVKVYASASTASKVVAKLDAGCAVCVDSIYDGWCRVIKNGEAYFLRKADLTPDAPEAQPESETYKAYVQQNNAKVYASWNTNSKVLCLLSQNTQVTVVDVRDSWCKVRNDRGEIAFMLKADLAATRAEEQQAGLRYGDKGDDVKRLQTRLKELGYFSGNIGGNYLDLTAAAVRAFQSAANLDVTGEANSATLQMLASDSAPEAPKPTGDSTVAAATGSAKEMDWWTSDIRSIFSINTVATITDVETGISWQEVRKGGTNHADVQPRTAADTAAMKKAYGGTWSWDRRAIIVTIDGVNYAASMNGMPHGSGSISDNNFDGHHCIHFTNSRTHGSNAVCKLHQAAIQKAAAWKG